MIKKIFFILLQIIIFCQLFECVRNFSGVETTNGDGFTVVTTSGAIEGSAPPYAQVFVFDTGYIPYIDSGIGIATSANHQGYYRIVSFTTNLRIFVVSSNRNSAGLAESHSFISEVSNNLNQYPLQQPGEVCGSVVYSGNDSLLVYLSGLCHYQLLLENKNFYFRTVPVGRHKLRIVKIISKITEGKNVIELLYQKEININRGEILQLGQIIIK
ncbi:MAG: hypothetical protein N2053_04180 [Chitinispirillaceae bacterium]|nr:hypothetical protein [Chitinispirillaceae bacterium]